MKIRGRAQREAARGPMPESDYGNDFEVSNSAPSNATWH